MATVDEKWKNFLLKKDNLYEKQIEKVEHNNEKLDTSNLKFSINISTKTKTLYFNKPIDIYNIFWNIDIINYSTLSEGIIKKEIKIFNNTREETIKYEERLKNQNNLYYIDHIIKNIDNENARKIKYKNQRKLIIGLSKKDVMKKTIMLCNNSNMNKNDNAIVTSINDGTEKIKGAFRNCLVLILLLLDNDNEYKESHVKIFNTGIIKIPGVLNSHSFEKIKKTIYDIIDHFEINDNSKPKLCIVEEDFTKIDLEKNVLINSNLKCGFNIYLDKFYKILRSSKYNIEVSMDTTTYPALRCKYYYHTETGYDIEKQNGVIHTEDLNMKWKDLNKSGKYRKVSVMIFRTGNGLIMGKISEKLLLFIFEKFKRIIIDEYDNIYNPSPFIDKIIIKKKDKQFQITKEVR